MISIIAAMTKNRVIGRDGVIPWSIPEDLRRFKELTMGHPIIMGRKTYEKIGHPLPGRVNIILTRQRNYRVPGCKVFHSLADAVVACGEDEEVFICGGGELYRHAISLAERIYLTLINIECAGDTFFPAIPAEFEETERIEKDLCTFILYKRK